MEFDAAIALRMITNHRLRSAGWGEYRDLGGALAVTSDAPIAGLNSIGGFTTKERHLEMLLDLGFALLRAFDRDPAVELTPLDRPKSIAKHLRERQMIIESRRTWMRFPGDPSSIAANPEVQVRVAGPDDAPEFARIHGGGKRWAQRLSLSSTLAAMHEPGNTFCLGSIDGAAAGVLHLLIDGATAGIYAVATLPSQRRRGVSTALIARTITDARTAGCDLICLSTESGGYAQGLYRRLGFEPVFESQLWVSRAGN